VVREPMSFTRTSPPSYGHEFLRMGLDRHGHDLGVPAALAGDSIPSLGHMNLGHLVGKTGAFTEVLAPRQDLEILMDVQPAHRAPTQRQRMVNSVRDAGLSG